MKKAKVALVSMLMLAGSGVYAQTNGIGGTVTDNTGEPIIGASVKVKGTTNQGTVTDIDGNFKLNVKPGETLVISYIGCKDQEVKAGDNLKIVLQDNSEVLGEVVVTGYQVQRKADLTGAVSVMNMKEPVSQADPNMLNSMQGKLAGVQVVTDATPGGDGASIRVRGMSSINGSSPLLIVDGIATTENMNSINPADIESIQVLKDASSASIYGSRAANGVIIVTTKRGKGEKLTVNVNYAASLQTVAKTYDMLNTQQWGEAYWTAAKNAGMKPSHPFYGSGDKPQMISGLPNTDWQDAVYSSAWTHNLSASVSNSGKKGSMLLSGNYINQDGLVDYTFYRRYSARLNSTYNISDYVSVGENLMVSKWFNRGCSAQDDRGIPFTAMRQHPGLSVRNEDGTFTNPVDVLKSDIANPVQSLYNSRDNNNESLRIFGNAYLELKPIKGLSLKTNLGYDHTQYLSKELTRKAVASDVNSMSRAYGQGETLTWTNTANYLFDIAKNHHFNVLVGSEAIKYTFQDLSAWRNNYAFEDNNYMQIGSGEGTQTNGGGTQEWALFSLFGKFDYNYADRYLFSATLRRDATSRLANDQNSGVFPAFSAAWRLSEEKFWKKNSFLTDFKLRAAWGQNGASQMLSNYASYSTYVYDTGNGSYDLNGSNNAIVSGIKVGSTGNRNLKWETTTQTNIGFDAYLFNNALNVTFDYYWKKTKDMLTVPPVLSVAGENATKWMNTGDMKNTGWELTVNYNSPQYGDWSWNGNFNISQYKNKVEKLNDFTKTLGGDVRLIEGKPMGVYYGYVVDGIFQNETEVANHAIQQGKGVGRFKYRDLDGNGVINENDQCVIGDPNPDFSLGLNLSVTWKRLTLSTFLTGEFGFDIYNGTKRQLNFMSYGGNSTNRGKDILNAWSTTNTSSSIPALTLADNNNETRMSTYFVEDGSYLKMKFVKLAYDLPTKWLSRIGASTLSVYGQLENVFTITDYSGLDPELPLGTYGARYDGGPYPRSRTFTVGVNLTF